MGRPRTGWRRGLAFLAAGFLLACPSPERDPLRARPDVFLIVIDTQRADRLSIYGYDRDTTPGLEAFARDAVVFRKAVSPGTWTVPSHASLFTGLFPSFHGAERVPGDRIQAHAIRPEAKTLAEILSAGGYDTAAIVANEAYVAEPFGFARGFRSFRPSDSHRADRVREIFLEQIETAGRPSFFFLNLVDPHAPYFPLPPFDTRFEGKNADYGRELAPILSRGEKPTPEMLRHFDSQYDGEVAFVDQELQALFDALRRIGRYDEALVIVVSDHGEILGEHGRAGHGGYPYEPLVHVPLIVKYPGNRDGGMIVERRVSTLGVFATILDEVGLEPPADIQSRPLHEPQDVWVEDIDFRGARVRVTYDGPSKLVEVSHADGTTVTADVYDLSADPEENEPRREPGTGTALKARARAFGAAPRPENHAPLPIIDAERRMRLRRLGYVE